MIIKETYPVPFFCFLNLRQNFFSLGNNFLIIRMLYFFIYE